MQQLLGCGNDSEKDNVFFYVVRLQEHLNPLVQAVAQTKSMVIALSVFGAWRYRNKVLHRMDFIFSSLGASMSKKVLKGNFGAQWKPFIRSYYDQDIKPDEAAALSSLMCLRGVLTRISQDEKNLALHAIRTDNRANMTANRLRSVQAGIALYGTDATAKAALYEIIGSLEGREGAELDDYRTRQLLADVLDMISPTQVPRDFTRKD